MLYHSQLAFRSDHRRIPASHPLIAETLYQRGMKDANFRQDVTRCSGASDMCPEVCKHLAFVQCGQWSCRCTFTLIPQVAVNEWLSLVIYDESPIGMGPFAQYHT